MPDRYAVIGNPIAQSRSPVLHTAFARQFGHDLQYEKLLATHENFAETVRRFIAEGGKGMNVTAPFKLAALEFADTLSERARAARAINTLKFGPEGVHGDNTDGVGLVSDIRDRLGIALRDRRILVIGAGGAARGILQPLLETGPAHLLLVNRTERKAHELLEACGAAGVTAAGPLDAAADGAFDVVINATSASFDDGRLPLGRGTFAPGALAYDLVYGRGETAFLRDARRLGAARVSDGLGMLVGQAAESYRLWFGCWPDVEPVMALVR
ncbi:shikimate dehydrogenase [Castellaniella defragrans]|jgi:shikimate dehydrogenase|uniref:Shikimate dehydrogenase (NADP(+)) n=2 Tax=Castellaniella defragrans TaxID=75697 RepID=W8X150_CASD6|nr:shikimate dehydrogenase [Castellaniella defragrans]KAB0622939.1 shikimate dehydrogenase [Castellaniella defragrans]MBB6085348.1 shikimate dehydrogenase [Castellaniella defragrans]CDM22631.1 Shikimate 5-dehydrogenase I alpha [Castellaniella defragrans 65Phen]